MRRIVSSFLGLNARASNRVQRRLPWRLTRSLFRLHESIVAEAMHSRRGQRILDVGGGRQCHFSAHRRSPGDPWILALDRSLDELVHNQGVDARIAADATLPFPLRDGSVDLVASRSVLEHLSDGAGFLGECHRVLRPGGLCVHVFPGRYAPFALLNRALPNRISRALLDRVYPELHGSWGFRAHYRDCYHPRIERLLRRHGFEVLRTEFRYYQSSYYRAFLPLFLLSLLYDGMVWLLGVRRLSSQILVVGRKPTDPRPERAERVHAAHDR